MITNLFRCSPDGTNIRWLSNNKDFDRYPHVMEDGQLLFVVIDNNGSSLWSPAGKLIDLMQRDGIVGPPAGGSRSREILVGSDFYDEIDRNKIS